jgi:hypothetical protein
MRANLGVEQDLGTGSTDNQPYSPSQHDAELYGGSWWRNNSC